MCVCEWTRQRYRRKRERERENERGREPKRERERLTDRGTLCDSCATDRTRKGAQTDLVFERFGGEAIHEALGRDVRIVLYKSLCNGILDNLFASNLGAP